MKSKKVFAAVLIFASLVLYALHYFIFRDLHHILIFSFHEIAFLPLEVLIVSLILEEIVRQINRQERKGRAKMIIGAFFSETGNELLHLIARKLPEDYKASFKPEKLEEITGLRDAEFAAFLKSLALPQNLPLDRNDFLEIKAFLSQKRQFILNILENPALSEDDSFTKTAFATIHLSDELSYRNDLSAISNEDLEHLRGDALRVLVHLATEWLAYLKFIKDKYPYLYSLSIRANPFAEERKVDL